MNEKPIVVTGEAPETDSEDENINVSLEKNYERSIHGAVITGEDSESEDENNSSVSSAISALKTAASPEVEINTTKHSEKHESLLHQKLRECNITLHADIESFSENTINEVHKTLSSVDQQILQSQVMLQSAVTSLRELSSNSFNIRNKLQSILTAKFLPNIITP